MKSKELASVTDDSVQVRSVERHFGLPERDKSLLILHPLSMCSGHCKTKELSELKLFSWFDVIFGNQCQIAKAIYHAKVQKTRHM